MSLYDDASLIMFPSGYKEDKIYSLKPTDGSGDLTFTRASTATRVNADGLIETSPVNLLEQSNTFNTTWIAVNSGSVVSGQSGYDGSSNAWTLTKIATSYSGIKQNIIYSDTSTFAIYAKANTLNYLWVEEYPTGGNIWFDLINGTTSGSGFLSSSMTSVGNGWWKCLMTASGNRTVLNFYPQATSGVTSTAGSIYIQDAQLNIGATAKPYFPTTDRLNVPRIDYTGGGCGKLLLEPQRSNLMLQSENLNSSWTPIRAIATSNAATSPDGTASADKIIADTDTNTTHLFFQNKTSLAAGTYTYSAFFKKSEYEFGAVRIATDSDTKRFAAVVNLNTGAITATDSFGSPTGTSSKVEDYGNGWYRLIVTCTHTSGDILGVTTLSPTAVPTFENSLPRFTGDNTSGVFTWGASLEIGSYSSSYIPTLASSVTRLADAMIVDDVYTNNLVTASGGTWYIEINNNFTYTRDGSQVGVFIANDTSGGTSSDGLALRNNGAAARLIVNKRISGVQTAIYNTTTDHVKVAIKWNGTTADVFENGVKVVDATAFTPTIMEYFGSFGGDVPKYIVESLLFPTALTDTQLATLTTL